MLPIHFLNIFHPRNKGEGSVPSRQTQRSNAIDSYRNLDESNLDSSNCSLDDNLNGDPNRSESSTYRYSKVDLNVSLNCSNISVTNNILNLNMDPDTIYKALRPVPEFDGNPNVLTRFIRICDQIVLAYVQDEPGQELTNLCLINGILNKITGPAARTINSNGIPESWLGIRNALINNFADQRDETALYNDLAIITQGNDSPQEFYDKCQNLFSTIMTYVSLHESVATTIEAKRDLYKKLTMQSFVRGLKEPLGSRIRCMRPQTIEKALEFVQEELNVMYLQNRNERAPERRAPVPLQPKVPYLAHNFNQPFKNCNLNVPGPSWQRPMPSAVAHSPWRPSFTQNQHPQRMNNQPTRTQQMFGAPPPNYNNSGFRAPPKNIQVHNSGPKPMSGVSHFVSRPLPPRISGHDWQRHGNPPPSNYFKTREINYNETYEDNDNYPEYVDHYDQYNYNDYYNDYNPYNYYPYEYQNDTHMPYEYSCDNHPRQQDPCPANVVEPEPCGSQQEQDFPQGRSNVGQR